METELKFLLVFIILLMALGIYSSTREVNEEQQKEERNEKH